MYQSYWKARDACYFSHAAIIFQVEKVVSLAHKKIVILLPSRKSTLTCANMNKKNRLPVSQKSFVNNSKSM